MTLDFAAAGAAFRRDSAVFLPAALDAPAAEETPKACAWSLAHPGPGTLKIRQHDGDARGALRTP
jgi:hypothetical protein